MDLSRTKTSKFDTEGRVLSEIIEDISGKQEIIYEYDEQGREIGLKVFNDGELEFRNETFYNDDNSSEIIEYDSAGNMIQRYVNDQEGTVLYNDDGKVIEKAISTEPDENGVYFNIVMSSNDIVEEVYKYQKELLNSGSETKLIGMWVQEDDDNIFYDSEGKYLEKIKPLIKNDFDDENSYSNQVQCKKKKISDNLTETLFYDEKGEVIAKTIHTVKKDGDINIIEETNWTVPGQAHPGEC